MLHSVITLSVVFFAWLLCTAAADQQRLCNGYAELCDRPYNNNTYLMTHDSYAYQQNPAATQSCPPLLQLEDGVRGIKLEAIRNNASSPDITVCHTSCIILDSGPPRVILSQIVSWLEKNPNEVLTIMWSNQGNFDAFDYIPDYIVSGMLEYSYVQPPDNKTWPTLGEMIDSGKRVVNFIDGWANQTEVPWLMDEFSYVFETPYTYPVNMTDLQNLPSFKCDIDRPSDNVSRADGAMYVMNHFVYGSLEIGNLSVEIPQRGLMSVLNDDSLKDHAQNCTSVFQRKPNFIEVDFYNIGDALNLTAQLNNVTYQPATLKCNSYIDPNVNSSATTLNKSTSFAVLAITILFVFMLC